MDLLKEHVINKLRESREELLSIPKQKLTGNIIRLWFSNHKSDFEKADAISSYLLKINMLNKMDGSWQEQNSDVCLTLRGMLIDSIDTSIKEIDKKQLVRPILDELISKISDTKLATLLREFNETRASQPNLACAGFRTILPLIIRERAKKVDHSHNLAIKDDIKFESDITDAIAQETLFSSAERKLLKRYLKGGDKDSFDNVVHKPDYLVDKSELDAAVTLLNRLLPTIVDK